jgi:3-oxoadipate enol-lactonase
MPLLHIEGRDLYYEMHSPDGANADAGPGTGGTAVETMIAMGGWGTYCHGKLGDLPRAVLADYRVLVFDYRGLGKSTDLPEAEPSTRSYAADVAALLDHLETGPVHVLGMVGMGACVGQELAINRPELVRSLVMTGCWAHADPVLADQLHGLRQIHQELGFPAFQRLCAAFSFEGEFYATNRDRILGPAGAWADLEGRAAAHGRLVEACLNHDTRDRLERITAPSMVLHAGRDAITTPRHTRLLEELIHGCRGEYWDDLAHVIAGKQLRTRFDALLRSFYGDVPATNGRISGGRS